MKCKHKEIIPLVASVYSVIHKRKGMIDIKTAIETVLNRRERYRHIIDKRENLEEVIKKVRQKINREVNRRLGVTPLKAGKN